MAKPVDKVRQIRYNFYDIAEKAAGSKQNKRQ